MPTLNLTELAAIARATHPEAHRDLPRAVLEALPPTLPQRPINKVRLQIMSYVLENWPLVSPLLSCPAKSGNPRACFQCVDVQVAECALTNPSIWEARPPISAVSAETREEKEEDMSEKFTYRSKADWLKQHETDKKEVHDALKAAGVPIKEWVSKNWNAEQKADALVAFQVAQGWKDGGKKDEKKEKKADKAPPATEAPTKAPKTKEVAAAAPAAEGQKVSARELYDRLGKVEDLLSAVLPLVRDTHLMARAASAIDGSKDLIEDAEYVTKNYGLTLEGSASAAGNAAPAAEEEEEDDEDEDEDDDDDEGND